MLEHYGIELPGAHVVIVGRGLTIGRPLANLLTLKRPNANAAVTVVHTGVADIGAYTRQADVLIAAAGSPHLVTADMVKPGAVVVAAGVSFDGKKVVSDVAADVADVAVLVVAQDRRGGSDDPGHAPGQHRRGSRAPPVLNAMGRSTVDRGRSAPYRDAV